MMTRQMLLRGTALVLYLFPFRVILRKNKLLHPTWGLYIYTRHEQQSHGTVNFASELGVEKDRREGEKKNKKNKKKKNDWLFWIPLVCRSATVGRDRQDARSSPSAETQKKRKR